MTAPVQPNLQSDVIANLDAGWPANRMPAGQGAAGVLRELSGTAGPTTDGDIAGNLPGGVNDADDDATGGCLRMVRVKSNVAVKEIHVAQDAVTTTAAFNVGVYYSDATDDGTQVQYQGQPIDVDFFASAVDTHLAALSGASATGWLDVTFGALAMGTDDDSDSDNYFTPQKSRQPLWKALGLSADPGGFFDICLTNTATISGAATLHMRVRFIEAA